MASVMAELIAEGKVLHWGLSNCSMDYVRRANAVCKVAAVQDRYSMMARWNESRFDELERLGIGFVAYSPLANGLLSAVYGQGDRFDPELDFRSFMPQYSDAGMAQSRELLETLAGFSEEKDATPAQVSLAWMLGKKPWIVPIPSSRKSDRNHENAGSLDVALTADEIGRIDALLDRTPVSVFGGSERDEVREAIRE